MNKTIELASDNFNGLAFINLVDFDAVYGHRRNAAGYGKAIEEFDSVLILDPENVPASVMKAFALIWLAVFG